MTDKRIQRADQLVERKSASVDELLEMSFGEWPPRGLDIVHKNPQIVALTTSAHDFWCQVNGKRPSGQRVTSDKKGTWGKASLYGARVIFFNKQLLDECPSEKALVLGHETTHTLQGDHFCRVRDIMGRAGVETYGRIGDTISNRVVGEAAKFRKGTLGKIFYKGTKYQYNMDHYAPGVEVQARLHEALIAGYPTWDHLPQNRDEFFFAMKSVGLALPDTLKLAMENHPDKGKLMKAFRHAKDSSLPDYSFLRGIEIIYQHLTKQGKEDFWHKAMPRLYADLIEMYGDRWGRERLELGQNETHLMRARHEQDVAIIAAQSWQFGRTRGGKDCAYTLLDNHILHDRDEKLINAFSNQFIAASVKAEINSRIAWLVVKNDQSVEQLKFCLNQAGVEIRDNPNVVCLFSQRPKANAPRLAA